MKTSRWRWIACCLATAALSCDEELHGGIDAEPADAAIADARIADARIADGRIADARIADARVADARDSAAGSARFRVTLENLADPAFPTPLSSGVWVVHADPDPLFSVGTRDRGLGLEALAEDGDPRALAAALDPARSGILEGPIAPGERVELVVEAHPNTPRLSFATMIMESNDVFLAPAGAGIALFDARGAPLPARDVTRELALFNAGTEVDQAPGQGPFQPRRQRLPNQGNPEGSVRLFDASTRALPLARDLADVRITESGGTFTITLENVSTARRLLVTDLSPVFFAVHDARFRLFEEGVPEGGRGLEALAEEGDPAGLVTSSARADGVLASGATSGRLRAAERAIITVRPDAAHPLLTLATRVVLSNDAFVSMTLPLLDVRGAPRPPEELALAIRRALAVFDAGTEANEMPGAGRSQASRAGGPPDPDRRVRRYDDPTNDLAGESAGGILAVSVRGVRESTFEVRVLNTSGSTPSPLLTSATAYAITDGRMRLFAPDRAVSRGLESLAEDCVTPTLAAELRASEGVREAAIAMVPDGESEPGPIHPDGSYTFLVTADAIHRWLVLATMPFPSNDLFVSLGDRGLALLEPDGRPRSDAVLAADVALLLRAFDAGTEANQSGAAGHDMPPFQESHRSGVDEGDGTVRREADPVWSYPEPEELVRVTIAPLP